MKKDLLLEFKAFLSLYINFYVPKTLIYTK